MKTTKPDWLDEYDTAPSMFRTYTSLLIVIGTVVAAALVGAGLMHRLWWAR